MNFEEDSISLCEIGFRGDAPSRALRGCVPAEWIAGLVGEFEGRCNDRGAIRESEIEES